MKKFASNFEKLVDQELSETSWFSVTEQYTLRNGNYLTITLALQEENDKVILYVVVSGASGGLLKFTFGANKSREKQVLNHITSNGLHFEIIEE